MAKFRTRELSAKAQDFVAGANPEAQNPPKDAPEPRIQVAFRLPQSTRQALTVLAAQRTLDTGKRVTEQALFEEAIALLLQKYGK